MPASLGRPWWRRGGKGPGVGVGSHGECHGSVHVAAFRAGLPWAAVVETWPGRVRGLEWAAMGNVMVESM